MIRFNSLPSLSSTYDFGSLKAASSLPILKITNTDEITFAVCHHASTSATPVSISEAADVMQATFGDTSDLKRFGRGVFSIIKHPHHLIKILPNPARKPGYKIETAKEQIHYFNLIYGDGSAKFVDIGERKAILMSKIEGKTINKLKSKEIPLNLPELMMDCFIDLRNKGIVHEDLQLDNFIYDKNTDRVYAIDITNACKYSFMDEEKLNCYISHFINEVIEFTQEKITKI